MYNDIWRKKVLPYFLFTRKERRGVYVLLAIITAMWMIPYFFSDPVSDVTVEELAAINTALDSLKNLEIHKPSIAPKIANGVPRRTLSGNDQLSY